MKYHQSNFIENIDNVRTSLNNIINALPQDLESTQ
jgi:hypothetical protein